MKQVIFFIIIFYSFGVIAQKNYKQFEVAPFQETDPVLSEGDAADDIAIFVPNQSIEDVLIIGTNKKYGLETYDYKGNRLFEYPFGRINNVDLLRGYEPNEKGLVALIGGTNRSTRSLDLWYLHSDASITLVKSTQTDLRDVYGFTFYSDEIATYAFVTDKKGTIYQYQIFLNADNIDLTLIRKLKFSTVIEGIEGDSKRGLILAAEENKGLWSFNAHPFKPLNKNLLLNIKTEGLKADLEGVALINDFKQSRDYIFISIQGSNSYGIMDAQDYKLKGIFKIISNNKKIDQVEETDGIEAVMVNSNEGLFIAQDGLNGMDNQNFKLVMLSSILKQIPN